MSRISPEPERPRPRPHQPIPRRPASATGAGVVGIVFGLVAASGAVYTLLLLTEGNGFGLFGLPVLAMGVGFLRNGTKVLAGAAYSGDRLSRLAVLPATISGLGIMGMLAGADWDNDATLPQLTGFVVAFLLSFLLIALCERQSTKTYLDED
ncbi:hypothetical protein [Streptomyces lavendulae]|uniref:hypothetical protein n=1 Tax=Streptomyces lavendulae TaxID=1914 RepID=UPI0024A43CE6|nr:hypothetical protein [Streptomyces lavendulae]GLX30623.1 hypothetical protein Slala02_64430 [Streptomyces lavendulae subsp. lavendulae]